MASLNSDPRFQKHSLITAFISLTDDIPVWYRIHEGNNDAEQFAHDIEMALACGFLKAWDVLVLDNAAYHRGKDNCVLEEWLWEYHGVFLLYMPARSPEWNPVELLWNVLVQRLRAMPLSEYRARFNVNGCAHAAAEILDNVTPKLVQKFYNKCYDYLDNTPN